MYVCVYSECVVSAYTRRLEKMTKLRYREYWFKVYISQTPKVNRKSETTTKQLFTLISDFPALTEVKINQQTDVTVFTYTGCHEIPAKMM